jgi:hypothetical protein
MLPISSARYVLTPYYYETLESHSLGSYNAN